MNKSATRIGVVILTYNSENDLQACLDGILIQRGIDLRLIVVDNASQPEARSRMESIFAAKFPKGQISETGAINRTDLFEPRALFLRNDCNLGYSAGNNIGARLAIANDCEAVLIVNPDVRIDNRDYLNNLWSAMRTEPGCAVGASRIINLAGRDEHPLREASFWEEIFWIRQFGPRRFRSKPFVIPPIGPSPINAEKLHGCCMLIRATFLETSGYLDENIFLYSEEPVLAAKVKSANQKLMVFPQVKALHAHVASTKDNVSRRMKLSIRSRLYYLNRYSGYGPIALAALRLSYGILWVLHAAKASATSDKRRSSRAKERNA